MASSQAASGDCPTAQPEPLPAGETRTATIETEKGSIVIKIDADLSPIAAGNFVALAECGYYEGVVFHRLVPGFVIQGGDPTGTGTGGPGLHDQGRAGHRDLQPRAPSRWPARPSPTRVGSQFFIVLDDAARAALEASTRTRSSGL